MTNPALQVVVGFDLGASSRIALDRALALAARAPAHVLHVVCGVDPHGFIPDVPRHGAVDLAYVERVHAAIRDAIGLQLWALDIAERVQFFVHVRIGSPAAEILAVAGEIGADLIIVGSKGLTGVERLVVGSVSERVVREAGCTVEVARAKTYAHVDLLKMSEVESHPHYAPPHRYSYEERRVALRPLDWPLY